MSLKHRKQESGIGTLIGVGTRIVGSISFVGGLRIDGDVTGDISTTDGTLVLGEQANIEGKLTAPHLLINGAVTGPIISTGSVTGPIISTGSVELQPRARVAGNIYYRDIMMHPGAVVDGKLVHCISKESSGELEFVFGTAGGPANA